MCSYGNHIEDFFSKVGLTMRKGVGPYFLSHLKGCFYLCTETASKPRVRTFLLCFDVFGVTSSRKMVGWGGGGIAVSNPSLLIVDKRRRLAFKGDNVVTL